MAGLSTAPAEIARRSRGKFPAAGGSAASARNKAGTAGKTVISYRAAQSSNCRGRNSREATMAVPCRISGMIRFPKP